MTTGRFYPFCFLLLLKKLNWYHISYLSVGNPNSRILQFILYFEVGFYGCNIEFLERQIVAEYVSITPKIAQFH